MEETQIDNLAEYFSSIKELSKEDVIENEISVDNNKDIDLTLDTKYKYVIFNRDDLLTMMNLSTPIVLVKSEHIVYNSITFVSTPNTKTLTMISTNELSLL